MNFFGSIKQPKNSNKKNDIGAPYVKGILSKGKK
jgi:hypothetical protein